jgi:drug/metabolite transporter (DMT)-like permease
MDVLLLLVPVITSTAIWPINRYVMQNGGRGDVYGFWISSFSAIVAGILTTFYHQPLIGHTVWWIGLVIGIAYSMGFCIVVNYCLKIGPTGPTVAANNMGLVGPVLVGLLWPVRQTLTLPIGAGILLVVLAIIGFSFSSVGTERKAITVSWALLVTLGWVLAALSMTGQYLGSVLIPKIPLAQVTAFNIMAVFILLPFVIRRGKTWFKKIEFMGGILAGLTQAIGVVMMLLALQHMPSRLVFPVTILLPLILVLMLSALVYKEHLNRLVWIACGMGVVGLGLLAVFQ